MFSYACWICVSFYNNFKSKFYIYLLIVVETLEVVGMILMCDDCDEAFWNSQEENRSMFYWASVHPQLFYESLMMQ